MTTTHPALPTIVVNTPGSATSTVSAPRTVPSDINTNTNGHSSGTPIPVERNGTGRPKTPTVNTTFFPSQSLGQKSCYLCDEQNPGDFSPTTKFLDTCLLCSRHFCPIHKAKQWDGVCNINHSKYYHDRLDKARNKLALRSPDGTAKTEEVEDVLVQDGVYPSLGEREKAIFRTSPVSDAKMKEIENFRSLDAEISGTKGQRSSVLIDERDAIGADIAV